MKLVLNIKPRKVTATTKESVLAKLGNRSGYTFSSLYGDYRASTKTDVIVYNLQKVNKKTKQVKKGDKTISTIIRKKEWVMHYYYIPFDVLKALGLEVKQSNRNFKIIKH